MSLFSSLQIANNTLIASSLGLQVVGNNIANANTPGYLRQELNLVTAPAQKVGDLTLGLGVQARGITQRIDHFLEDRLRTASSDLANGEAQESTYLELESIIGELGDTDLSSSLSNFFNSIQDILNQPESLSVRNIAVLKGETLSKDMNLLDQRVRQLHKQIDDQVYATGSEINRLLKAVADLNVRIVNTEGGSVSRSDAVGLRDQREVALKDLANLLDIRAVEQESGDVTVFVNGEYLVAQGNFREVKAVQSSVGGLVKSEIRLAETESPINSSSGKLAGNITSRDTILEGFLNKLNEFSRNVMYEFNKQFASGQGLTGYSSLTSEFAVDNTEAPLDEAGLPFTPQNGSFQVVLLNKQTGLSTRHNITVDLNGFDEDTSLTSLTAALDAIDGISARIDETRHLRITSDSTIVSFSFADDTSGVLAAMGVNTFFSGVGASDVAVNDKVRNDPAKFAASRGGIGEDSDNAVDLASLLNTKLDSLNGESLAVLYDRMTSEVAQGSSITKSVSDGYRTFQKALEGQHLAVSGVSLDEEAVRMIAYQRAYQASARLISTINEIFDVLVNL
jgi:flagellar hook-associated protein 1